MSSTSSAKKLAGLQRQADEIAKRVASQLSDAEASDLTPIPSEAEAEADTGPTSPAESPSPPADKSKPKPKKRKAKAETAEDEAGDGAETSSPPKKRGRKAAAEPELDGDGNPIKPKRAPRKKKEPELDEDGNPIVKPKRKRAPKPEPVYEIPDVQPLKTNYKGRLGYACLNTILRNKKPASEAVFCARTCRIATIKEKGMDFLKEIARQNIKDCLQLLEWNEKNNIRFMRLSSEMCPFASHAEYGYDLSFADAELKALGEFANKHGHRLTTHPGQFTQLGSPRKEVVDNAIRDLKYHSEMLDRIGCGKDSVMIIHGGGVYGDKQAALQRIRENFPKLPQSVRDRVVFENDEVCFCAGDLLPLSEELQAPFVLDYHHDWIYPSSQTPAEMMPRILATWNVRGGITPKQHLSEPRPGAVSVMERRAHSDRIKRLPDALPPNVDLMLEAKDKEQAVLELYRIYGLHEVDHASLRPANPNPTLATGGRKSHSPKKKGAAEDEAVEGEDAGEGEDVKPTTSPRKKRTAATATAGDDGDETADVKPKKPRKSATKKAAAAAAADRLAEPEPGDVEMAVKVEADPDGEAALPTPEAPDAATAATKPAKGGRKRGQKQPVEPQHEDGAELVEEKPALKRRKTVKTED